MKLLLYCTKAKPMLRVAKEDLFKHQDRARCYKQWEIKYFTKYVSEEMYEANGKIVAECDFEVEWCDTSWCCGDFIEHKGLEKSCLTKEQLFDYVKGRNEFYAIHIKNLHIFDKPRKLEFYSSKFDYFKKLEKAPQNMMKVWEDQENPKVLISIRPEWLCKILNGEKIIEVRKKVLKEML